MLGNYFKRNERLEYLNKPRLLLASTYFGVFMFWLLGNRDGIPNDVLWRFPRTTSDAFRINS